uniref:GATA-type domain-containing protein n=1 Tax=Meloidogyne enterolobii TaxID=390850 RepID=A0A6V7W6C5_MELEN|nr:unnamed protein product [Meloidogyne enterolobii]
MIKLIIASCLYLLTLLNIKCDGKKVSIVVKIKDDWEEKREFIYLKNVELEERFVLEKIVKKNNQHDTSYNYNIEKFLRRIEVNNDRNIFIVEIDDRSEYAAELKRGIIERNKRNCFNCRFINTVRWYKYLKEHYLCQTCHEYKIYNGKMRPQGRMIQNKMRITQDRKCFTCGATKTSHWYCHSEPEKYICDTCYNRQRRIIKKTYKNHTEQEPIK